MKSKARLFWNLIVLVVAGLPAICAAQFAYDAAGDFSPTNNPNGPWSYGWTSASNLTFNLYTNSATNGSVVEWRNGSVLPNIVFNPTDAQISSSSVRWRAHHLSLHPSISNEHSVIRFTCPRDGGYRINTAFDGRDVFGTSTDVTIHLNSTLLYAHNVSGYNTSSTISFSTNITVKALDTIDFRVGYGAINYTNDTTGAEITIIKFHPTLSISVADVDVCWDTRQGALYQLEYSTNTAANVWTNFGGPILGSGSRTCVVDTVRGTAQRFYRVRELP